MYQISDLVNIIQMFPLWGFFLLFAWSIGWKIAAMWKAAKRHSLFWFVFIGIVDTAGILEIIYIFIISEMKCCQLRQKAKRRR